MNTNAHGHTEDGMDSKVMKEPTEQQIALARFADEAEASGLKTSMYYRLWPQIQAARAALSKSGAA